MSVEARSGRQRIHRGWLSALVLMLVIGVGAGIKIAERYPLLNQAPSAQAKALNVDQVSSASVTSEHHIDLAKSSQSPAASRAGDSETKAVDFEFGEDPGKTYATRHLAAEFAGLASAAENGDLIAARTLMVRLETCSRVVRNDAAMKRWKDKLKNPEYIYQDMYKNLPGGAETRIRQEENRYRHCGELSDEQRASQHRWVEQLADAGDIEARLRFPYLAQPQEWDRVDAAQRRQHFVEHAQGYLNAEIASGNGDALGAMAQAYMKPIISGETTPFEIDPAMAYRYYYAYAQTAEGQRLIAMQQNGGNVGMVDLASSTLIRLESQLTPEQIANERREANAIFKACCF